MPSMSLVLSSAKAGPLADGTSWNGTQIAGAAWLRGLADALDRRKHGLALLLADGVAEHPSDQPDIVSQRPLSIRKLTVTHWFAPFSRSRMRQALQAGLQEVRLTDGRRRPPFENCLLSRR